MELVVEILEIAKDAAEKEVLADVAERPLDLALCFCAIGPAGARLKAVMTGEVDESAIVDDEPVTILPNDGGLHSVVQIVRGAPLIASRAAIWQRRTLCRSW